MKNAVNTHQHAPLAVSPDEAARLAGIGRTTLYAALAKGDLPSIKIGTRRLIRVEAILDWLKAREVENATGNGGAE
ncbi:MAG: helix-turn-helix domain-containing protein [Rhodobacteraceae bacterium]|nr:helix-turn-helix domain-containing protein [Paracoccaceae bacterium]